MVLLSTATLYQSSRELKLPLILPCCLRKEILKDCIQPLIGISRVNSCFNCWAVVGHEKKQVQHISLSSLNKKSSSILFGQLNLDADNMNDFCSQKLKGCLLWKHLTLNNQFDISFRLLFDAWECMSIIIFFVIFNYRRSVCHCKKIHHNRDL